MIVDKILFCTLFLYCALRQLDTVGCCTEQEVDEAWDTAGGCSLGQEVDEGWDTPGGR